MRILIDANLPLLDKAFPPPFQVSRYENIETLRSLLPDQDILLCRSTLKVNQELLQGTRLRYVATASSGSDHLDKEMLGILGIEWMDAKGCNAHSVADYLLSVLAALHQEGLSIGKKVGIIGCGQVGTVVSHRLTSLAYQIRIFDPLKALREPAFDSQKLEDLEDSDLVCIHAELHDDLPWPSRNLLNQHFLSALKPGTIIVNASRGGILNEQDLLDLPFHLNYCTDVYENEPDLNPKILKYARICTPHIAGHSIEAKEKAVRIVSEKLHLRLGFAMPFFEERKLPHSFCLQASEKILDVYDPRIETEVLKKGKGNREVFLKLRAAHNLRHDIDWI